MPATSPLFVMVGVDEIEFEELLFDDEDGCEEGSKRRSESSLSFVIHVLFVPLPRQIVSVSILSV